MWMQHVDEREYLERITSREGPFHGFEDVPAMNFFQSQCAHLVQLDPRRHYLRFQGGGESAKLHFGFLFTHHSVEHVWWTFDLEKPCVYGLDNDAVFFKHVTLPLIVYGEELERRVERMAEEARMREDDVHALVNRLSTAGINLKQRTKPFDMDALLKNVWKERMADVAKLNNSSTRMDDLTRLRDDGPRGLILPRAVTLASKIFSYESISTQYSKLSRWIHGVEQGPSVESNQPSSAPFTLEAQSFKQDDQEETHVTPVPQSMLLVAQGIPSPLSTPLDLPSEPLNPRNPPIQPNQSSKDLLSEPLSTKPLMPSVQQLQPSPEIGPPPTKKAKKEEPKRRGLFVKK